MIRTMIRNMMLGVVAVIGATRAHAGPADDRLMEIPIGSQTRHGLSVEDVTTIVDDGTFRVTDLRVEAKSPLNLSVVLIRNEGAYLVQHSRLFHGKTIPDTDASLRAANERPILVQAYSVDGVAKAIGISVPNSGANFRNWKIVRGTPDDLISALPGGSTPRAWRPMTLGTYINPDGVRHWISLAVENVENIAHHWHFNVGHASQPVAIAGERLIDACANDDDAMRISMLGYFNADGEGWVPRWFASRNALDNFSQGRFRPLFVIHYTLHGTGTLDGAEEFMTSFVADPDPISAI